MLVLLALLLKARLADPPVAARNTPARFPSIPTEAGWRRDSSKSSKSVQHLHMHTNTDILAFVLTLSVQYMEGKYKEKKHILATDRSQRPRLLHGRL